MICGKFVTAKNYSLFWVKYFSFNLRCVKNMTLNSLGGEAGVRVKSTIWVKDKFVCCSLAVVFPAFNTVVS